VVIYCQTFFVSQTDKSGEDLEKITAKSMVKMKPILLPIEVKESHQQKGMEHY